MALSILEQLEIRTENKIPVDNGNEIVNLQDFIMQAVINYGLKYAAVLQKEIPTIEYDQNNDPVRSLNTEANSYLQKHLTVVNRVINYQGQGRGGSVNDSLNIVLAYLGGRDTIDIGEPPQTITIDFDTVNNATASQWEAFLDSIMPTVFEVVSGVTEFEKTSYTNV